MSKRMRSLRGKPAATIIGTLRGSRGMGDLISGIEAGVSNDINNAPSQALSSLIGSVAAQPSVQAAAGAQLQAQSANALSAKLVAIMNNPTQLALYAGGAFLLFIVAAKVLK